MVNSEELIGKKVNFTLELYSFFNLGARWGWVVNATPWPLYAPKLLDPHFTEGWVGPRAGLHRC
jgi:hypothetical protein